MEYYDYEKMEYYDYDIPSPSQECQFPFKYLGDTYNGCTLEGEDETGGIFWCCTERSCERDEAGWGICENDCPKQIWVRRPPKFEWQLMRVEKLS